VTLDLHQMAMLEVEVYQAKAIGVAKNQPQSLALRANRRDIDG
jgi:hypothetical protein